MSMYRPHWMPSATSPTSPSDAASWPIPPPPSSSSSPPAVSGARASVTPPPATSSANSLHHYNGEQNPGSSSSPHLPPTPPKESTPSSSSNSSSASTAATAKAEYAPQPPSSSSHHLSDHGADRDVEDVKPLRADESQYAAAALQSGHIHPVHGGGHQYGGYHASPSTDLSTAFSTFPGSSSVRGHVGGTSGGGNSGIPGKQSSKGKNRPNAGKLNETSLSLLFALCFADLSSITCFPSRSFFVRQKKSTAFSFPSSFLKQLVLIPRAGEKKPLTDTFRRRKKKLLS